jgi:hypothetical protein
LAHLYFTRAPAQSLRTRSRRHVGTEGQPLAPRVGPARKSLCARLPLVWLISWAHCPASPPSLARGPNRPDRSPNRTRPWRACAGDLGVVTSISPGSESSGYIANDAHPCASPTADANRSAIAETVRHRRVWRGEFRRRGQIPGLVTVEALERVVGPRRVTRETSLPVFVGIEPRGGPNSSPSFVGHRETASRRGQLLSRRLLPWYVIHPLGSTCGIVYVD